MILSRLVLFFSFLLVISGCSLITTAVESGKDIGTAAIDEVVDITTTAVSIPVQAVGTVIDKLEEETSPEDQEDDKKK
tara:strand:+ start:404 stop:637 length:234 start_codon:yes stop_codon:yes gene_type:complete